MLSQVHKKSGGLGDTAAADALGRSRMGSPL